MGNQPSIIVMFSDVIIRRTISMDHQTLDELIKDSLIDRLHKLVDEQRYEDAIAYYEEHAETLAGVV